MAEPVEKPQEKKPANQLVMLAAIMVVSTFASSFMTAKMLGPQAQGDVKDSKAAKEGTKAAKPVTEIIKLGEFVVNLANKDATRYLKADISVENTKDEKKPKKEKEGESKGLGDAEPKIRDLIIAALSSHTTQELGSMEGKTALKTELIKALNDNVEGMKIVNIYFNSFMMQ
jgi:flagellar FliL protein